MHKVPSSNLGLCDGMGGALPRTAMRNRQLPTMTGLEMKQSEPAGRTEVEQVRQPFRRALGVL